MRALLTALVLSLATLNPGTAMAWGEPGHQVIGSIAQQILEKDHPDIASQVKQILPEFDLPLASTWADCARDVHKDASGTFSYATGRYTPNICLSMPAGETQHMIDYASRNWDNCVYTASEGCLGAYHFADAAYQHGNYSRTYVGTSEHDIVSAINAAIIVLQGGTAPEPFSIASKREALLMLAHFVGDLHQPLHVGAVYLDPNGSVVDPDAQGLALNYCEGGVQAPCTEGGNAIATSRSENLHHVWDTIPAALGTSASADLVSAAEAVPATDGPVSGWAAAWASDTVNEAATTAFQGPAYAGNSDSAHPKWTVTLPATYASMRDAEQRQQLIKGGGRLAQLLVAALSAQPIQ
ncbi:MAG: S1/P1 nuclease [Sphingomonadales bacterium]|nr:S1/P1 nuclease [Sphingomonadales bacterium]MDE2170691.1 S1/P1 nuclease [Sphingomonadales bacterium]